MTELMFLPVSNINLNACLGWDWMGLCREADIDVSPAFWPAGKEFPTEIDSGSNSLRHEFVHLIIIKVPLTL